MQCDEFRAKHTPKRPSPQSRPQTCPPPPKRSSCLLYRLRYSCLISTRNRSLPSQQCCRDTIQYCWRALGWAAALGLTHPAEMKLPCTSPRHGSRRPPFNSASMSLTVSDSSYKWYHAVFVLVCLAYFTVLHIHPCCHQWQGSLLVKQFLYDNSVSEC